MKIQRIMSVRRSSVFFPKACRIFLQSRVSEEVNALTVRYNSEKSSTPARVPSPIKIVSHRGRVGPRLSFFQGCSKVTGVPSDARSLFLKHAHQQFDFTCLRRAAKVRLFSKTCGKNFAHAHTYHMNHTVAHFSGLVLLFRTLL